VRYYFKNNQCKKTDRVPQVVEGLPTKYKALSSNPHTAKKKKKGRNKQANKSFLKMKKKTLSQTGCLTS
jgi:hypothetical protein